MLPSAASLLLKPPTISLALPLLRVTLLPFTMPVDPQEDPPPFQPPRARLLAEACPCPPT